MRRLSPFAMAFALAALALPPADAGERGTRVMAGWFNVTTPEGWVGRRYMDGSVVFAEEFDSNRDGRIDVWRFYRRGLLSSEERDLDGDGRVDFQSHWEARDVRLLSVFRDTNRRGVNDLEIEATSPRAWEIREDRNLDGIADRVLLVNGPPDLFDQLGMDLSTQRNVIDAIPSEFWNELWLDNGFSGAITEYYRYNKGALTHRGDWNSRGRFAWVRADSGYVPPSPPPLSRPDQVAAATPPREPIPGDIRDPFNVNAEGVDPYAQPGGVPYGTGQLAAGDTYAWPDPYAGGDPNAWQAPYPSPEPQAEYDPYAQGTGVYQDPSYPPAPAYPPPAPPARDRTRYEGLPPGDSAARSVPARMRPPGSSRR